MLLTRTLRSYSNVSVLPSPPTSIIPRYYVSGDRLVTSLSTAVDTLRMEMSALRSAMDGLRSASTTISDLAALMGSLRSVVTLRRIGLGMVGSDFLGVVRGMGTRRTYVSGVYPTPVYVSPRCIYSTVRPGVGGTVPLAFYAGLSSCAPPVVGATTCSGVVTPHANG